MHYLETTPDADPNYTEEKRIRTEGYADDVEFQALSRAWRNMALKRRYTYGFSWLGRPMIQLPTDALAIQELIWTCKPTVVIETGIAHGGSLVLSASILALLGESGRVIGIDIDIRDHNRAALEAHPLFDWIELVEGSSVAPDTVERVRDSIVADDRVLVILDSNHTHAHVLAELNAYGPMVAPDSYCVVFDTFVEEMPEEHVWEGRPWGIGNSPMSAVKEWLSTHPEFEVDRSIEHRLMTTSAPSGFLRRVR
jgi:cephalosporin hydroxylase